ncbi:MAG: 1-acyl-sn-glycerol-3-phosphate acyltransferase [Chloroflexi bacterium]|nr:1-acyl-sn-glycerol-3-phosphate acyltransferase [Chloroflexota bacterium]
MMQPKPLNFQQQLMVIFLTMMGRLIEFFLTRTTYVGLNKIPQEGPLLIVSNHASTYDALLIRMIMPRRAYFVGPGDFKLALGGTWVLRNSGVIFTKRGSVDRQSLKQMEAVLNNGEMLGIFPEGGTWEKRIKDVKAGAAYLSATTNAPLLPMAFGGTYQVWYDIFRFQRPRITVRVGDLLPPVELSGDRKTRQDELQQASIDLMWKIYAMLPEADQKRYDEMELQRFSGAIEVEGGETHGDYNELAELLLKPNLLAPLKMNSAEHNAPFTSKLNDFVPVRDMLDAVQTFQTLLAGDFKGYLEYRLDDAKSQAVYRQLDTLAELARSADANARLRLVVEMYLVDETEPHSVNV